MRIILISIALVFLTAQAYAENTKAPTFTLADAAGNEVTLPRQHDGVDIYLFWAARIRQGVDQVLLKKH